MNQKKIVPQKHHLPKPAQSKRDQSIEALFAENLVIHEMLMRGHYAVLMPQGYPSSDSMVFSPHEDGKRPRVATVQSKFTGNGRSVKLRTTDFDFLVVVRANKDKKAGRLYPETWVAPQAVVQKYWNGNSITTQRIPDEYKVSASDGKDVWMQIIEFLKKEATK